MQKQSNPPAEGKGRHSGRKDLRSFCCSACTQGLWTIIFLSLAWAQSEHSNGSDHQMSSVVPLKPAAKIVLSAETNRPIYRPARCDSQGRIYFRGYQLDDRRVPIVRTDG